jgi:hypothetical protein
MTALGCLVPFVLMIAGSAIGAAVGGTHGGVVGLIAGLALGVVIGAGLFWALARVERG